ncbi:MAG: ABC transporter permease [Rhodospirillales bacterium]|nr:ABC transporter permease [Rhodospirillales bacterium]
MAWVLRRIGASLLLVWVVVTVVFMAIHLVPGDPAELLLSQGGSAPDPAAVAALRGQLGLDRPLLAQYGSDLVGLLHGDLGLSLQDQSPVAADIAQRLPRTIELLCAASILALGFGVPLGTLAGIAPGGMLDRAGAAVSALLLSVPVFVVGTLLVLVFAEQLGWADAGGFVPIDRSLAGHFAHLAMPALTIALGLGAMLYRITRAAVLDVALRDYVRTARAKGVAPRRILWRHVLRNALSPVVTVFGLQFGALIGGTVLVEYVFNYPGLSGLLVDAVNARDYPLVQGIVLVISVLFVAINLTLDLLYAALDPRVRGR